MHHSEKILIRVVVLGAILIGSMAFATSYHKPDLFPIGFSGIGNTGYPKTDSLGNNVDGSPYPNTPEAQYPYGTWAKEVELLELTGANFIGCSDADGDVFYYLKLNPTLDSAERNDFYNRVCLENIDKNVTLNYNPYKTQNF